MEIDDMRSRVIRLGVPSALAARGCGLWTVIAPKMTKATPQLQYAITGGKKLVGMLHSWNSEAGQGIRSTLHCDGYMTEREESIACNHTLRRGPTYTG
jgi:hypothetical protein